MMARPRKHFSEKRAVATDVNEPFHRAGHVAIARAQAAFATNT